jgi:hypothetical protein
VRRRELEKALKPQVETLQRQLRLVTGHDSPGHDSPGHDRPDHDPAG